MTTEGTQTDASEGTQPPDGQPETGGKPIAEMTVEEQLDYFKARARKAEDRLRDKPDPDMRSLRKERDRLQRELDDVKRQTMTDAEKAIAEAVDKTRANTLAEVGGRLVAAEVKVATSGRNVDADALLDGIDTSKFLGDDGQPDSDAIAAWIDRVAPAPTETNGTPTPAAVDLGQGARGGQPADTALGSDPLYQSLKATLGI